MTTLINFVTVVNTAPTGGRYIGALPSQDPGALTVVLRLGDEQRARIFPYSIGSYYQIQEQNEPDQEKLEEDKNLVYTLIQAVASYNNAVEKQESLVEDVDALVLLINTEAVTHRWGIVCLIDRLKTVQYKYDLLENQETRAYAREHEKALRAYKNNLRAEEFSEEGIKRSLRQKIQRLKALRTTQAVNLMTDVCAKREQVELQGTYTKVIQDLTLGRYRQQHLMADLRDPRTLYNVGNQQYSDDILVYDREKSVLEKSIGDIDKKISETNILLDECKGKIQDLTAKVERKSTALTKLRLDTKLEEDKIVAVEELNGGSRRTEPLPEPKKAKFDEQVEAPTLPGTYGDAREDMRLEKNAAKAPKLDVGAYEPAKGFADDLDYGEMEVDGVEDDLAALTRVPLLDPEANFPRTSVIEESVFNTLSPRESPVQGTIQLPPDPNVRLNAPNFVQPRIDEIPKLELTPPVPTPKEPKERTVEIAPKKPKLNEDDMSAMMAAAVKAALEAFTQGLNAEQKKYVGRAAEDTNPTAAQRRMEPVIPIIDRNNPTDNYFDLQDDLTRFLRHVAGELHIPISELFAVKPPPGLITESSYDIDQYSGYFTTSTAHGYRTTADFVRFNGKGKNITMETVVRAMPGTPLWKAGAFFMSEIMQSSRATKRAKGSTRIEIARELGYQNTAINMLKNAINLF